MLSYVFYTTYFLIACAIFGNSVQKRDIKWCRAFLFMTLVFMAVMMALRRGDVGNDTGAYCTFFNQIVAGNINYDARLEIGFRCLAIFTSKFSSDAQVFTVVCVIITFVPVILLFAKYSKNIAFSVALFWAFTCINLTSATRQGIAIGFICIGYLFLRRYSRVGVIVYCISCAIAALFHSSAIIMIVMPLLRKRNITIGSFLIILISPLALIATNFVPFVFSKFVGDYYREFYTGHSGWVAPLFNMLLGASALLLEYYYLHSSNRELYNNVDSEFETNEDELFDNNFLRWSALFSAACCILSVENSVIGREALYFDPFLILYISKYISRVKYSKLFMLIIIFARVGYTLLALIIRPEWNSFFPFYFFWQK